MSIFSKVAFKKVPSNTFDLSHQKKMSARFGELTPSLVMDVVPGDTINLKAAQLVRFAPMTAPIMHQISVYQHYFFVPNRILWDNWEDFITGGEDGLDVSVPPTIEWSGDPANPRSNTRLGDLLGLPINNWGTLPNQKLVDALPFAAYQEIYNEYYRDQNLIPRVNNSLVDGNNTANVGTLKNIRKRAWQHDYFTSALPWTQKGPEATIPLGTTAPINFDGEASTATNVYTTVQQAPAQGNLEAAVGGKLQANPGTPVDAMIDNSHQLQVDLTQATASSINDLRRAFRLQEWLEKNARGGSRYIESILVHFGVKSSDARLQRPEYLGGGATPVQVSEVLQTSGVQIVGGEPINETPQGNMAGHGISAGGNQGFKYHAEEHGYILGIMSIMPKTAYQQGIPAMFNRKDKFDYYWPEFANIGEQPILMQELYQDGDGLDNDTFGYKPRYAEYKYLNDTVHGDFKDSLKFWHMGRIFTQRPVLDQAFIEMDNSEVERVFAVGEEASDPLYVQVSNQIKARRKMPVFGIPTI